MYQHIAEFQAVMAEHKIDLSVLRMPENLTLFSQYWPRNANSYLVVPAAGEPSVVLPLVEATDAEWAGLHNIISYNDVDMAAGDTDTQIEAIFEKLAKEHNIGAASTIGLELDYDVISPCFCSGKVSLVGAGMKKLVAEGFGCERFSSVTDLLIDIMAVKNESDVDKLQKVNALAKEALDHFEELANAPGARELDLVKEVERYIGARAYGFRGGRVARGWGQLSTGPKSEVASCEGVISDDRELQKGDCCLFELGICLDGYWADITRSLVVGGATGTGKEMLDLIDKSFQAGVDAARVGATGRDVDLATRKVMEEAGYGQYYLHAAGHGVGFAYHEHTPELNPNSTAPIQENMVLAIEPGLYVPGVGGLRKELNILVKKDGNRILG